MNRDDILAILGLFKHDFAEKCGILELGVFGSVARGTAGAESDLDICIKTRTPYPFMLVHVKEDLERLIQKHVDIVRVREKMNPFLRERIEKECIYILNSSRYRLH